MAALFRYLILPVFVVLAAYSMIRILKTNYRGNEKLLWIVLVAFVPVLGVLLYLLIGRKYDERQY